MKEYWFSKKKGGGEIKGKKYAVYQLELCEYWNISNFNPIIFLVTKVILKLRPSKR